MDPAPHRHRPPLVEGIRLSLNRWVPAATWLVLLALGLLLFRDYGMSWDEEQSRTNGMVSAKYAFSLVAPDLITEELRAVPDLATYQDRDYGVGFELPAYAGEKLLGLTSTQSIYFYRHLLTYLVFALGVMATYGMAARRHGSWMAGLLAAALLYLSPGFLPMVSTIAKTWSSWVPWQSQATRCCGRPRNLRLKPLCCMPAPQLGRWIFV